MVMTTQNNSPDATFDPEIAALRDIVPQRISGTVTDIVGMTIVCVGLPVAVGSLCTIQVRAAVVSLPAEVIGFRHDRAMLMALGSTDGIAPGDTVTCRQYAQRVRVGSALLGRVLDGRGLAIDGKGTPVAQQARRLHDTPPHPLERDLIDKPLGTGVRAIDGCATCGRGQRMGIFSGSGVGKSVLLGMIARGTEADVNVIALIGERGREVREFIERDLGEEGLRRSVVVVATSDQSPLLRVRAAFLATCIAESFRDEGRDVMFMMDSVTRTAMAQREIGLAAGEPPATKGYPPSVFALLPKLMERAGQSPAGSITGFYTVLVEADDMNEPISDTCRSILDGHLWLDRSLAARGHFPAIDILDSVSRIMPAVVTDEHMKASQKIGRLLSVYKEAQDLINIGAYVQGSNPEIDAAIVSMASINEFLQQNMGDLTPYADATQRLCELADAIVIGAPSGVLQKTGESA